MCRACVTYTGHMFWVCGEQIGILPDGQGDRFSDCQATAFRFQWTSWCTYRLGRWSPHSAHAASPRAAWRPPCTPPGGTVTAVVSMVATVRAMAAFERGGGMWRTAPMAMEHATAHHPWSRGGTHWWQAPPGLASTRLYHPWSRRSRRAWSCQAARATPMGAHRTSPC